MKKEIEIVDSEILNLECATLDPMCKNAMVHVSNLSIMPNGKHKRRLSLMVYLLELSEDPGSAPHFARPKQSFKVNNTGVEPQLKSGKLDATLFELVYKSKKGATKYRLYSAWVDYISEDDLGVEDIIITDLDPETTRGTVTTVKNPST